MDASRMSPVLVVHPSLEVANQVAQELAARGFASEATDELPEDDDPRTLRALVLFGSVQWWVGVDNEHAMPPTVLVGGDALGLARAAGATRCREDASMEEIAHSLRALLRLSGHSRGRGTMPLRVASPFIVKVGRWMSAFKRASRELDVEESAFRETPVVSAR